MINRTIIEGRLAFEPELKHLGAKNTSNVTNTLCCSWYQNAKNQSTFIKTVFWGRIAENIANYCSKGTKVTCIGRLVNNKYTNRSGVEVNEIQFVVEEASFEPKKNNSNVQVDSSIINETEHFEPTIETSDIIPGDDDPLPFY